MDYHKERFQDYSLMVFKKNKLVSILPANIVENKLYSHQGLSYGGLILSNKSSFQVCKDSFYAILKFLFEQKISTLFLKQLPKIYNVRPSDELDYLFYILKAEAYRKDISMAIQLTTTYAFSTLRKRQLKKATQIDMKIALETDLSSFWNDILIPNLMTRHHSKPTHSLSEITKLRESFPNNIKHYNVYVDKELVAGCTVFESNKVVHLQYISTKKDKNIGALDYLINHLISNIYKDKEYFDFGISNENEGKNVNEGLLNWKQSFGASAVVHDFYKIQIENYSALNNIMI